MTYDQVMMQLAGMAQKFGVAQSGMTGTQHTLGMWQWGLPDILMRFPNMSFCHRTMNDIYLHWRENGVTLGDDKPFMAERSRGRIYNCYFTEIDLEDEESRHWMDEFFPHISEFYKRFPALRGEGKQRVVQFVLPDKNNKLPFESDYDSEAMPQKIVGVPLYPQELHDFLQNRDK